MKTAVIDVDHIFYLSLTGEKVLDEMGQPVKVDNKFVYRERTIEESYLIADRYIINILNLTGAKEYVGFFGGSSLSRKVINEEYKANRKDTEPLPNLELMKSYLRGKWYFYRLNPGSYDETDDYVASYMVQNPDCFIISPDKDLLNLEGTHYNPKKNEWVTTSKLAEYNFFWKSMVCGDTADNIPGIKGLGEKAFEGIMQTADLVNVPLSIMVFRAYIEKYGEVQAVKEFYKNYSCLYLKKDLDLGWIFPTKWEPTLDDINLTNYSDEI